MAQQKLAKKKLSTIMKEAQYSTAQITVRNTRICVDADNIAKKFGRILRNVYFHNCEISFIELDKAFDEFDDCVFNNVSVTLNKSVNTPYCAFSNKKFNNCKFIWHKDVYELKFYACTLTQTTIDMLYERHLSLINSVVKQSKIAHINQLAFNFERTTFERCLFIQVNFTQAYLAKDVNFNFNTPNACEFVDCSNILSVPPESGAYIGYKIARVYASYPPQTVIVKLQIPAYAKRSSATTRKCRASAAKVLSITSIDGKTHYDTAQSVHDRDFSYVCGATVKVDDFDDNRFRECSTGIHHFITRDEAVQYGTR